MIEILESRRLLSALPIDHEPVDVEAATIRVVTLEEFLQMETWNDDEIVVEWYTEPVYDEDDDWFYEPDEEDPSDEEGWMDDVCEGPDDELDDGEALDDEDWALVEESDVLDAPIVVADAGSASAFSDEESIGDQLLGSGDDELLA